MLNSGLDPTLLIVLSILALVTILVVLVVCALVAFRYHFVVVVDVAVVVVDGCPSSPWSSSWLSSLSVLWFYSGFPLA